MKESSAILSVTGCGKPCVYNQYRFVGDMMPTGTVSEKFIFGMWTVSEDTEQLLYLPG